MIAKIPTSVAARVLQKSENFVRWGLQTGRLPIGCAVPTQGSRSKRYSYYISPVLLAQMSGRSLADLEIMSRDYWAERRKA